MVDRGTVDFLLNYEGELRGMTRPDKGVINSLTMLAADNQDNYNISFGIVQTVEQCVRTLAPHLKLIPLYLMDSIVKNVGGMYTRMFMQNLTEVFSGAFAIVDNKTRESFIKLLDTWRSQNVFPAEKNEEIRACLTQVLTSGSTSAMMQPHMNSSAMHQMGNTEDHRAIQNRVINILGNLHQPQSLQQPQPVPEPRMDWQQQMQQQLRYGQTGPLQSHGAPQYSSRYPEQQHYPHVEPGHGGSSWSTSQAPQVGVQPENQRPGHALQSSAATNPFSQLLVETPSTQSEVTAVLPTKRSDPRTLKVSDLESFDVSDVVKSLYDDYPFQCKTDGKRFKSKEVLEKHLDRLFSINKARKDCTGVKERHWFSKAEEWCSQVDGVSQQFEKSGGMAGTLRVQNDATPEKKIVAVNVHADQFDHGVRCAACNEQLKKVYDNEEDVWVFRGCVRVGKDGHQDTNGPLLVHAECFQPGACLSPLSADSAGQW